MSATTIRKTSGRPSVAALAVVLLLGSGAAASGAAGQAGTAGEDDDRRASMTAGATSEAFVDGRYEHAAGSISYRLYRPTRPVKDPALVVMLHGCTQDARDLAAGTRANEYGEERGVLVLYPEQSQDRNAQKCWNWYDPAHQARGQGEPAMLAGLTRQVMDEHGVDPGRVFAAGISAGGAMAQILAATYPDLYRAIAVHSAPPFGSARDVPGALAVMSSGAPDPDGLTTSLSAAMGERVRPVSVLVLHGAADPIVKVVNGRQVLRQWAGLAGGSMRSGPEVASQDRPACPDVEGLTLEPVRRVEGELAAQRCVYQGGAAPLEYWEVEGLGHAWSGGSADGTFADPRGPGATAQIFRFFLGAEGGT